MSNKIENVLTPEEEEFCWLYVNGGGEYTGNRKKCYEEAFGFHHFPDSKKLQIDSSKLFKKPHVYTRIKQLIEERTSDDEAIAIKLQITDTMRSVMEETSTAQYKDKWGVKLSPAPLRAVAVNAARLLADIYPIKHAAEQKIKVSAEDSGGIVFNVIVPESITKNKTDQNETEDQTDCREGDTEN